MVIASPSLTTQSADLQTLLRANLDAFLGLRQAAQATADRRIAGALDQLATERAQMVADLRAVTNWDSPTSDAAHVLEMLHEIWQLVRQNLELRRTASAMDGIERAERIIRRFNHDALLRMTDHPLRGLLNTHGDHLYRSSIEIQRLAAFAGSPPSTADRLPAHRLN